MLTFSEQTRAANLIRMAEDRFDVLVIGGGITGVGIALDAAARGLSVALVEKDDFAAGTSGRSSRLVHGGLRYLEHGSSAWCGSHCGSAASCSGWRRTWCARFRCTCWPATCAAGPSTGRD